MVVFHQLRRRCESPGLLAYRRDAPCGTMSGSGDRLALMGSPIGSMKYPAFLADVFAERLKAGGILPVLKTVRKYLGMDVAFVSHFRESDRILEHIDAEGASDLYIGQSIPLEQGYCLAVARGELPELIPDTSLVPAAVAIPETQGLPIGSHLSVPIQLRNGALYGTLCCFSYRPDRSLGERDLKMMHAFAEVLGAHFDEVSASSQITVAKRAAVQRAMAGNASRIVYQPIYGLKDGILIGMECLSRFDSTELSSPNQWFDLAEEVGMRQQMELSAIRRALRTLDHFPASLYFGLNCSPETILSGALPEALEGTDPRRLVVEITEHAIVADYDPLTQALQPLRRQGLRVAIDDAGAGYASMRHIVSLLPDFIKLDMSLTRAIDTDPTRRALARAMTAFAHEIGSQIIAEGIETRAEFDLLRTLGVDTGQGFLLSRPLPLALACRPEVLLYDVPTDQIRLNLL